MGSRDLKCLSIGRRASRISRPPPSGQMALCQPCTVATNTEISAIASVNALV